MAALPARADAPVTVFAAASLQSALREIANGWTAPVRLSVGGSAAMARQVTRGAPADLVILAHPAWDMWLSENGPPSDQAVASLVSNTLVLIAPQGAAPLAGPPDAQAIRDRLQGGRLAVGLHAAVPAGQYAKEWLEWIGAWETIRPHLAEVENVRIALAFVARAEAPLGIVYRTDARSDPAVQVVYDIPPETHSAITYPARSFTPAGSAFLTHLQSPEAHAIFRTHGFLAPLRDGS